MGRRKGYDRDELVAKAMELFRDHGYAGTSAEMLVEGLGVNRYSIYAEFGSKQGLFNAALERYDEEVIGARFGKLEMPGAGLDEIRVLLEFYGAAGEGPATGRGCLLCNTAVEFGPNDPDGSGFVQRYFGRLSNAFLAALRNEMNAGGLRTDLDLHTEANDLTATVLGLFVMIRAKAPRDMIASTAANAIARLGSISSTRISS